MNFCFNSTNIENDLIVVDAPKCQKGSALFEKPDEFQQNCTKRILPNTVVRSSSLSKITSSSKTNLNPIKDEQIIKDLSSKPAQHNNVKEAIVNKLLKKNQISNKSSINTKNKQNHNQKQKSNLPEERFYHKHQNIDKLIKLYKEKSQKQLKQCTFNPKIHSQKSTQNLNTQQFYKEQIQHCKRTQDKIQQMRLLIQAQKQKQNTFKPKLSEQTLQLTQRRVKESVYDRLYNQNKDQRLSQAQGSVDGRGNQSFRKQTSKKSISLVSNHKKRNLNFQSQQKDLPNQTSREKNCLQDKPIEIKRQKSIKSFKQFFERKESKQITQSQSKQTKNRQYLKWKRPSNSQPVSNQNSQKKRSIQNIQYQFLDCRQLIKHKQQSSNLISREKSCKLIQPQSNQFQRKKSAEMGSWNHNKQTFQLRNKTTQKNEKIALQRFTKEFFTVIQKMELKNTIDLTQMISLMKNMNFIENLEEIYESQKDSEVKEKTFQIWTILEGSQKNNIVLINLFKLLCAIQGFNKASMIQDSVKAIKEVLNKSLPSGNKQEKKLVLSQKDSIAIKKDFMNFYLTRFKLGQSKLYARQLSGNNFSFKPSISKQSSEYAEKYRERIICESEKLISQGLINFAVPEDGMIDHSTLLILDQKIKNYKIQQKRLQSEREKRRKEEESMSKNYTPNRSINQTPTIQKHRKSTNRSQEMNSNIFSRISHNQSHSRSKDQLFVELYGQGRKSRSNRRDKSTEEIQYESNKQELTFKPKINQLKDVSQFKQEVSTHDNIPNFTKEVMRMRTNKNIQNKDSLSASPLMYLNVKMQGNSQTKIPVYERDNLHDITEKVRVMMKIENGQQERQKLKRILREQIIPVLDQLGIKDKQSRFLS